MYNTVTLGLSNQMYVHIICNSIVTLPNNKRMIVTRAVFNELIKIMIKISSGFIVLKLAEALQYFFHFYKFAIRFVCFSF